MVNWCCTALADNQLTPTKAGKLVGVRAFLESATYGRIGKAGQRALLSRVYANRVGARKRDWRVHDGEFGILADALHVALCLALDPVPRIMHMQARILRPLVIASDAMAEQGTCRGGYLAVDLETSER